MSSTANERLSPVPPLPADVRAILEVERSGEHTIPGNAEARLRRRVEMSVGVLALSAGTVTAVAATGTAAKIAAKPWILAFVAFVLGGLAGAGFHAYLQPHSQTTVMPTTVTTTVTTVYVEKTVSVPVPAAATDQLPTAAASGSSSTTVAMGVSPAAQGDKSSPSTAVGAGGTQGSDVGLAAERSLLEVARTALSRGDFASAMSSLDTHQKKFPKGVLREEREALYVQALARSGRHDEAKARAERFVKAYPKSMLLPVVEAATE